MSGRTGAPRAALAGLTLAATLTLCGCKASRTNAPPSPTVAAPTPAPTAISASPVAASRTPGPAPSVTVVARAGTPGLVTLAAAGPTPASISVQAGRTVTFLNNDSVAHRIISVEPGLFDTGEIAPGQTAAVTISAPGVYDWRDSARPALSGTVRILP